jgi:hypothetical protein
MSFDIYGEYSEVRLKESLTDWGFFGHENIRPKWLQCDTKAQ